MPLDDSILAQCHDDLDRAMHLLRLIKEFRGFAGGEVPESIRDGSTLWTEATDLLDTATRVRTDLPILAGSILLYVCGRFEYFVRELIIALADDLAANATVYSDLPDTVRKELRVRTLEVAQSPQRFGYTEVGADQLLVSLTKSLGETEDGAPVAIASSVLSLTESNMNSRTLSEIFKRVNASGIWTDVGKQAPLKATLGKATDGECTKEAMSKLDTIMKERNGIAHPTSTTTFPDPDQVLESAGFLRLLSSTLVDLSKVPKRD